MAYGADRLRYDMADGTLEEGTHGQLVIVPPNERCQPSQLSLDQ